jgi:hypothetical protein
LYLQEERSNNNKEYQELDKGTGKFLAVFQAKISKYRKTLSIFGERTKLYILSSKIDEFRFTSM